MEGEDICVQQNSDRRIRISCPEKKKTKTWNLEEETKKNMYPKEESYPRICEPKYHRVSSAHQRKEYYEKAWP